MKPDDLLTDAELRARMGEAAAEMRTQADNDAAALKVAEDDYATDLGAGAFQEIVAEAPAIETFIESDDYAANKLVNDVTGANAYERSFNDARRDVLSSVAAGVDQFVAVVLQEAVDTIDELRNLTDEIGVEAAQLTLAAASGYLVPPTSGDIEDMQDQITEARDQAVQVQREVANLRARRDASRLTDGAQPADDFPVLRALPTRPVVRTDTNSESSDRDDEGASLAQGAPGQTRNAIAADQNERLQELLRAPALDRINYIAICAVIKNMTRSKDARDKATRTVEKLRGIYTELRKILSGDFLEDLQENLENEASTAIGNALTNIQAKLDATDGFLAAIARLPGPFVSTVRAMGDVPDTAPVVDSITALCGLKGARFCDLQGMIEIARSLDIEFGLQMPTVPMIGRAVLLLDAPEESQAPHHVVVPGQEADLILVSVSATTIVARFSRAEAPVTFDGVSQSFIERADVFGDGGGEIILIGNGTVSDVSFTYTSVSYSPVTNNYTFTVTSNPGSRVPTVRGQADGAVLPGLTGPAPGAVTTVPINSWNDTILFPVGTGQITLRVPEAQARDISLPCDLALGFGEQTIAAGEYDATVANQVRALAGTPFASWMVGLTIDLGNASATGQAEVRTIASFVDEQTITYAGDDVPGTLAGGTRGTFRFTGDTFEVVRALSVSAGPHVDLKTFALSTSTTRPHQRELALPQIAVRVVPTVRDTNLDVDLTPAQDNVRDLDITPEGATVLLATYEDADQDAYFTPILVGAVTGKLYVDGVGPLDYTAVSDEAGAQLRFVLAEGTPQAFPLGARVEVETTSLLDRFSIDFPEEWFDPIDAWLLNLGAELARLEAKLCRLLSGSNQDIAQSAAVLTTLATALSLQLTTARFAIVAWLVPLSRASSLTRALQTMEDIGAKRAARQVREGKIGEFVAMTPTEGNDDGATLIVAQTYQNRVTTEEQYRILSKSVAEVKARFDAVTAATNAVSDLRAAQEAEMERRREGARRIEALQEKLP